MTTRRQLEGAVAHVAVLLSQQHRTMRRDRDIYFATCDELLERSLERDTLLAENATIRTESDELESLIHRLCDDRRRLRAHVRFGKKMHDLLGRQSLDFCQKYEVEEARANTYRQERDDARQTIGLVRLECERLHEDNAKLLRKLHTARGFGGKGVAKTKGKGKRSHA